MSNCPADCVGGGFCGDGLCADQESEGNCPIDCAEPGCGNRVCEGLEVLLCPEDCPGGIPGGGLIGGGGFGGGDLGGFPGGGIPGGGLIGGGGFGGGFAGGGGLPDSRR